MSYFYRPNDFFRHGSRHSSNDFLSRHLMNNPFPHDFFNSPFLQSHAGPIRLRRGDVVDKPLRALYTATIAAKHHVRALLKTATPSDHSRRRANPPAAGPSQTAIFVKAFTLLLHLRNIAIRAHALKHHLPALPTLSLPGDTTTATTDPQQQQQQQQLLQMTEPPAWSIQPPPSLAYLQQQRRRRRSGHDHDEQAPREYSYRSHGAISPTAGRSTSTVTISVDGRVVSSYQAEGDASTVAPVAGAVLRGGQAGRLLRAVYDLAFRVVRFLEEQGWEPDELEAKLEPLGDIELGKVRRAVALMERHAAFGVDRGYWGFWRSRVEQEMDTRMQGWDS
ncbi:hypothetical protein MFIFM68171_09116 [Madurella fahalii]|uniref:Uncharacterized protein n=1 Tax=Madurella fahalii TaxID=1157608 RepID=A0ABQ0GMF2_9PEZI